MGARLPERRARAERVRDVRFRHRDIEGAATKPSGHVIASGITSAFVWAYFRSGWCAAVSFAAGVLIDLDHLFDYFYSHSFTANPRKIYDACLAMNLKKWFLLLHSYELVALLWASIWLFSLSDLWKAAAIGFTLHLVLDQLLNPINTYGYFLTFRIMKGFNKRSIIKEPLFRCR